MRDGRHARQKEKQHSLSRGITYLTAVSHATVLLRRFKGLGFGLRNLRVAGVLDWCNGHRVGSGKKKYCGAGGVAWLFMRGVKEYGTRDDKRGGVDRGSEWQGSPGLVVYKLWCTASSLLVRTCTMLSFDNLLAALLDLLTVTAHWHTAISRALISSIVRIHRGPSLMSYGTASARQPIEH